MIAHCTEEISFFTRAELEQKITCQNMFRIQGECRGQTKSSGLFADACVVSSVHRPHLLARFDGVVFMEQGNIVDVGTAL
jgi:hypothetical protein